jgi:hypothetical protein
MSDGLGGVRVVLKDKDGRVLFTGGEDVMADDTKRRRFRAAPSPSLSLPAEVHVGRVLQEIAARYQHAASTALRQPDLAGTMRFRVCFVESTQALPIRRLALAEERP